MNSQTKLPDLTSILTIELLEEWVQDVLLGYAVKGYSQEDVRQLGGHFCHHPDPKWAKGTKGVWMFVEDHAIHGVLQSEVFQHPCIYGWEAGYLVGELYDLCKKWHAIKTKIAFHMPDENGTTPAKNGLTAMHGEKDEFGRSAKAVRELSEFFNDPVHQSMAAKSRYEKMTEGEWEELRERGKLFGERSKEQKLGWFDPTVKEIAKSRAREAVIVPLKLTNVGTGQVVFVDSAAEAARKFGGSGTNWTRASKGSNKVCRGWRVERQ